MERQDIVLVNDFCVYHSVSYSFITGLQEAGLVSFDVIDEQQYLHTEQLKDLESLVRMHTELDINLEGIEAIAHLLNRVNDMQQRMETMQQRLKFYEDGQ